MRYSDVTDALDVLGNVEKAAHLSRFFKTGPGQYGAGDRFIGVRVPEQRTVAKRFCSLPLKEIGKLLAAQIHEYRLTGLLILVDQYSKAKDSDMRREVVDFYMTNLIRVNNWDLVDLSAPKILGEHLLHNPEERNVLFSLIQSANLWERRVAVVATLPLIRQGQFGELLILAKMSLTDSHDLMHKAVGWMLREIGKTHLIVLEEFLGMYAGVMPRTMLRYAIELFEPERRQYFMKGEDYLREDIGLNSLGTEQHG
ncbi:MAG: DNA alkylation repair protein [Magnetococcus sp. YQC-5]